MRLLVSQCFHLLKLVMCMKSVFIENLRVLAHLTSFLLKNAFKSKEMLVSALVSLLSHISMRLLVSQCFHCVKTGNVHETRFYREITRFTAINVVFAKKNSFTRKEMFVLALVSLLLHNLMRLLVSQCFHLIKTDNVHKTRF